MSLLAVGALLEGEYRYSIVDGNLEDDPLKALDAAVQAAGVEAILALTVMPGPQLEEAVPLCRELKRRHSELPIVWGGYFPSQHWDACLRADYVDYVVRGHGEHIFLQLLSSLERERDNNSPFTIHNPELIPGLAYRNESGDPVSNPTAPIPHPERLPAWNLDRVDVARYMRPTFLGARTLGYHSSYGCPFFCNFCAVVNMVNGRWFPQPAGTVADAVITYKSRWGVDAVEFYDNNFFTQQARVAEFSQRIVDLDVAWWGEGRIDTMQMYSDKTWALMRDAGLKMVFMGAESGSDETLKRMDKGGKMSTRRTLEMAGLMKSYGIVPEFSFVLGNPPDPEEDMRKTIEFIRKVKKVNPAAEIIMYLYTPVPLSGELYEQAKAEGFAFPETLEGWISPEWLDFSQRRSESLPWIKRGLQEQLLDFERVINAYYPTSTDAKLSATWRALLRAASAWRYHTRFYHFPVELRAMSRMVAYQRPETSGF
jgi:radical SAM superfamily enzyme YgiQ (UPF0313 family)